MIVYIHVFVIHPTINPRNEAMCPSPLIRCIPFLVPPSTFGGYPISYSSCSSLVPLGYYFVALELFPFDCQYIDGHHSQDNSHGLIRNRMESAGYSKDAEPVDCCDLPSSFLDLEGFTPDGYFIREYGDHY